jgi:hypothetical protein
METEVRRDLPCANPDLVEEYMPIEKILEGNSGDFDRCYTHNKVLCECHLDKKREDDSYKRLVVHFRAGGLINQPIYYNRYLHNGHHRLAAAMDAGYTHVPTSSKWGLEYDWENTERVDVEYEDSE